MRKEEDATGERLLGEKVSPRAKKKKGSASRQRNRAGKRMWSITFSKGDARAT